MASRQGGLMEPGAKDAWGQQLEAVKTHDELSLLWNSLAVEYLAGDLRYWDYNNRAQRLHERAEELAGSPAVIPPKPLRSRHLQQSAAVKRAEAHLGAARASHPSSAHNIWDIHDAFMDAPESDKPTDAASQARSTGDDATDRTPHEARPSLPLTLTPIRGDFPHGTSAQPRESRRWRTPDGALVVCQVFSTDDLDREVLETIWLAPEQSAERSVIAVSPVEVRRTLDTIARALTTIGGEPVATGSTRPNEPEG